MPDSGGQEQGLQNSVVQNAVAERGVNPEDATQRALPCLKVSPRQVLKQMVSRNKAAIGNETGSDSPFCSRNQSP